MSKKKKKKISDEDLIEERLKGKTLSKICDEYGYKVGSENYLQKRLRNHGWDINLNSKEWVKLNRLGVDTWFAPLNNNIMKNAGLNPSKRYEVNREVIGSHKILLRFREPIGDDDEEEEEEKN